MKTVKREIIIRDSDLTELMYKVIRKGLYDRVEYEPLTYQGIQNENLIKALRNQNAGHSIPKYSTLPNLYQTMLWHESNLYNKRYLQWHLTMDYPAGQIYVQSRKTEPRQGLVRATLEKDIE